MNKKFIGANNLFLIYQVFSLLIFKFLRLILNLDCLASVVLTDTQPTPTAMSVIGAEADGDHTRAIDELAEQSSLDSWMWRVGVQMPLFHRATRVSVVFAADAQAEKSTNDESGRGLVKSLIRKFFNLFVKREIPCAPR